MPQKTTLVICNLKKPIEMIGESFEEIVSSKFSLDKLQARLNVQEAIQQIALFCHQ